MTDPSLRRAGGRSAKHLSRAAPLAAELRPVRAGLEGGAYKPLSDADVKTVSDWVASGAKENYSLAPLGSSLAEQTGRRRCRRDP